MAGLFTWSKLLKWNRELPNSDKTAFSRRAIPSGHSFGQPCFSPSPHNSWVAGLFQCYASLPSYSTYTSNSHQWLLMYIGIDPGKKGAVAILDRDGNLVLCKPLPHFSTPAKPKTPGDLDCRSLAALLAPYSARVALAVIEKPIGYTPNASAMMKLGESYGALRCLLTLAAFPLELAYAKAWKGHLELSADKSLAINLANALYGTALTAAQDGLAEAVLLAHYAKLRHAIVMQLIPTQSLTNPQAGDSPKTKKRPREGAM